MKILSLDYADTIIPKSIIDYFWLDIIPEIYATKHRIDIDKAREIVLKSYDEIGPDRIEWYLVDYWLKKFEIVEYRDLLFKKVLNRLVLFDDVIPVLKILKSKGYTIVISSNTTIEFIELSFIKYSELKMLIDKVYSSISNFGIIKKSREFYLKILQDLCVSPENIIHIGDNYEQDYLVPSQLGIKCFLIDRFRKLKNFGVRTIRSLSELLSYLK